MNEELKKIFEGLELSEDFKTKVAEVFEKALEEKTATIKEEAEQAAEDKYAKISEEYSEYVQEEMSDKLQEYIEQEFVPVVERYIDYAAGEFVNENKLVIESETKVELADKFLSGFANIAEQYNVVVPEGQDDVVAKLKEQVEESQKRVDALLESTETLKEEIVAGKREKVIESVTEGMTDTQREKIVEWAEDVKYRDDEQFASAITELKESVVPSKESTKETLKESKDEHIDERNVVEDTWLNSLVSRV